MNTSLVVGVDTTVGANCASRLADKRSVVGLSSNRGVSVDGCDTQLFDNENPSEAENWLSDVHPERVLYCGPAARSCWDPDTMNHMSAGFDAAAARWAAAAQAAGAEFTMISSDAVFTGPWIFHDEESLAVCRSTQATAIRDAEKQVREACPNSLIVRTNAFGWAPTAEGGWIERLLSTIENRRTVDCDCIRHATPILATDLAEILDRAWQEELTGVFHIAGAERVSPMQFAQRLADQFDLPWLSLRREQSLVELPQGFGVGETSLQTKKIRKALCVAMPMLTEGLARLHAQRYGEMENVPAEESHITARVA
ncbi:MAG: sugar nucleotide-binding protein [Planctomycetaceae bacterium]|nr:sugar nucleotide-binding protein [Planctomycetaceae bacterium]